MTSPVTTDPWAQFASALAREEATGAMSLSLPVVTRHVTFDEFAALPETKIPMELVGGQIVVSPSPSMNHGRAVHRLGRILEAACPTNLEIFDFTVGWRLLGDNFRIPDFMVVPAGLTGSWLTEPPLLAVEVLSPGGQERDLVDKRREYGAAGLTDYWVVNLDPAEVVRFEQDGRGSLALVAHVSGDDEVRVGRPFPVRFRPSDLVG